LSKGTEREWRDPESDFITTAIQGILPRLCPGKGISCLQTPIGGWVIFAICKSEKAQRRELG
jgi:hypothetical protein